MRILQVHNYYRSHIPSGENQVVDAERELLLNAGHEVSVFSRHNDEAQQFPYIAGAEGLLLNAWNPRAVRSLQARLSRRKPDVVHLHNVFPLISPAVLSAIKATAVPVVWTVHNMRFFCAAGTAYRTGESCFECHDQASVWPAIRHGCYRGRLATLPVAFGQALHQQLGTWKHHADVLLALTEKHRQQLIALGLPAERLQVKPNFVASQAVTAWPERAPKVIFVGRLEPEKGPQLLLDAVAQFGLSGSGLELEFVGDGSLREALQRQANDLPIPVHFSGMLGSNDVKKRVQQARLLVVPSLVAESFGMTVIEAFAAGVPVLVADAGSLPELIQRGGGEAFAAGDPGALAVQLAKLWRDQVYLQSLGEAALRVHKQYFSAAANLKNLEMVYETAMAG